MQNFLKDDSQAPIYFINSFYLKIYGRITKMTVQTALDIMQKLNEIFDIKNDYDKISMFIVSMNWQELQAHLVKLQQKYFVEVSIYNLFNTVPPQSLFQNAINYMNFLRQLAMAKCCIDIAELTNK